MATFRKRNNLWQVQVRSRKYGSVSKSFQRKADARKWALEQEALTQSGRWSRTMDQDPTPTLARSAPGGGEEGRPRSLLKAYAECIDQLWD